MSHPFGFPYLGCPFGGRREFGVAPPYSDYFSAGFLISLLGRGRRKYSGGSHPPAFARGLPAEEVKVTLGEVVKILAERALKQKEPKHELESCYQKLRIPGKGRPRKYHELYRGRVREV